MTADLATYLATQPGRCQHGTHVSQLALHPDCPDLRKLAGITSANDAASDDVKARIDAAIARWAAKGVEWSLNDLRGEFADVTGPIVGARVNAASRAGLIVATDKRVASTLPSTHGHPIVVWRGAEAARWHETGRAS